MPILILPDFVRHLYPPVENDAPDKTRHPCRRVDKMLSGGSAERRAKWRRGRLIKGSHTRMNLVIEADEAGPLRPDRQDCPEAVTSWRDATEEKGNDSAKTKCCSRVGHHNNPRNACGSASEPNGRLHSPVGDARKRPGELRRGRSADRTTTPAMGNWDA